MVCRSCGFDPVIYVKNPQKAAQLVREFLDRRSQEPTALLRRPLNLPKRARTEETKSGVSVKGSRQVSGQSSDRVSIQV